MSVSDFGSVQLSTQNIADSDRLSFWQEQFGRGMLRLDVAPASKGGPAPKAQFCGKATLTTLPGVRTIDCATNSAVRYDRNRGHVSDGNDSIGLVINLGPRASAYQSDCNVALMIGDAVPMFTASPAVLTTTHHIGVLFPRHALASRVPDLEKLAARAIPYSSTALGLLVQYVRYVKKTPKLLGTPRACDVVASHLHDLAALALCERNPSGGPVDLASHDSLAAGRLASALAHIDEAFADPEFSIASLAARLQISTRYVQRLLDEAGATFTSRVSELRLHKAFKLLTDRDAAHLKISEVALRSGFADVSHFNRLFRIQYGDTPSAVRAARHTATRSN